jgi:ABC-type sugar transport system substrate-binding protein
MKKVALLLDHEGSLYERVLATEAATAAVANRLSLLPPTYASGSSFTQLQQLLACSKGDEKVDAAMIMPAGAQSHLSGARLVTKAGISLIFLNRVPDYVADLRSAHPELLVTSVAPDQEAIGRIQAAQCQKLVPGGGYVLLVLGEVTTSSAIGRRKGFLERASHVYDIHELEGRWTEEDAFKGVTDAFRLGLERSRPVAAVVCQNDRMAAGARRALLEMAQRKGAAYVSVPLIGCDGQPTEGLEMVRRGELAATVLMPATTPTALRLLARYWEQGERSDEVLLPAESYPALDKLGA